jgi:predicted kinase
MTQKMILVRGLPGSGKSTVAHYLVAFEIANPEVKNPK